MKATYRMEREALEEALRAEARKPELCAECGRVEGDPRYTETFADGSEHLLCEACGDSIMNF